MSNNVSLCVPPRLQREEHDRFTRTNFGNCWQSASGSSSTWY
jgi:hypothetical protein